MSEAKRDPSKPRAGSRAGVTSAAGLASANTAWRVAPVLLALCSSVCGPPSASSPTTGTTARTVPGSALRTADDIVAVDVAVSGDGTLHLVWNSAVEEIPGTLPRHVTRYGRAEDGGTRWNEPVVVADTLPPVRLVAGDGGLHLVAGPTLRRFRAAPPDFRWQELEPLLPRGPGGSIGFDLAAADGVPIVASLRQPRAPYDAGDRGPEHRAELVIHRLGRAGAGPPERLAYFPPALSSPPPPRLLATDDLLHLLVGLNQDAPHPADGGASRVGVRGAVLHLWSPDGGRTWQGPAEIAAPDGGFAYLEAVDLALWRRELLAFVSAHGIFAARSAGGGQWSPVRRIDGLDPRSGGSRRSHSIAAGTGWVAWIDQRHRKAEGRWWNPLGGFPWSDDTKLWANNDVLALHLDEVAALLDGGPRPEPARLTPELAFARALGLARLPEPRVVWAGRRKVGKGLRDFDEPPAVFLAPLPAARPGG